jgi:hypothetical protein
MKCVGGTARILITVAMTALAVGAVSTANAQTYHVIHDFSGPDGEVSFGELTFDKSGNLYGSAMNHDWCLRSGRPS